jgi:hypothetical protein
MTRCTDCGGTGRVIVARDFPGRVCPAFSWTDCPACHGGAWVPADRPPEPAREPARCVLEDDGEYGPPT